MPQYQENIEHDNLRRPDAFLFLRAMRAAMRRYKLWGTTWIVLLLLSLIPALQTAAFVDGAVGNRYPDADTARGLHDTLAAPTLGFSEVFRQDNAAGLSQLSTAQAAGGAVLALFAFLFGVFAAGGWLQVTFEQPHQKTLRRFGLGGARYFARFLRVGILALLMLSLVHWIYYGEPFKRLVYGLILGVPEYDWGSLETLESERQVAQLGWLRDGLAAISFAKVMAWAIYTRTRISLRGSRSAIAAGIATAFTMMRHPIQTFRPLILLLALEALVVVLLLGWWKGTIDVRFAADPNAWHVAAMFGVVQIGVIWRQITRGAYYHAAGRVSQALILPTVSRPDPWSSTIGGPGGPQYPVEDDGYHVTI